MKKIFLVLILTINSVCSAANKELLEMFTDAENGSKSGLYNLGFKYSEGDDVKENQGLANEF